MHAAFFTAMYKVVIPRVEMVVKSITGSSAHGLGSEVLYHDRRDFLVNTGNTPLMSASSRVDLNTNQDRNDETREKENFEHGDFPAIKSNDDRRTQAHHSGG